MCSALHNETVDPTDSLCRGGMGCIRREFSSECGLVLVLVISQNCRGIFAALYFSLAGLTPLRQSELTKVSIERLLTNRVDTEEISRTALAFCCLFFLLFFLVNVKNSSLPGFSPVFCYLDTFAVSL